MSSKIKKTVSPKNTNSSKQTTSKQTSSNKTPSNLTDKFEFYARIVKLIVLREDDPDVISKYSTWLDTLRRHKDARIRYDYVRLLILGLEQPMPTSVCPFNDYPPEKIEPLVGDDWTAAARHMFFDRQDVECSPPAVVLNPPVITTVSDDRRQFAAYQMIPNAGLQVFYARSNDPLHEWTFKDTSPAAPPENSPHATALDWERSLAGIRKVPDQKDTFRSSLVTTNDKSVTFENKANPCAILKTDQENMDRGYGKFKWNDKSLLINDTVPETECCVDWMIHEQEKTQLEIDEDMVRSFDKLYPDNFRLLVSPELLEGLVKKMECAEQCFEPLDVECEQMYTENVCCMNRQQAGNDYSRTPSKQLKSGHSSEDLLKSLTYDQSSTPFSKSNTISFKNDELHRNIESLSKTYIIPEFTVGRLSIKQPEILPSFQEAASSFHSIANKAEDTMKEVDEWLKYQKQKLN